MTVIEAKNAGFCFGVDRAVNMTREALEKGEAWSLGELIHNRDVVDMLAAQGLSVAERVEDCACFVALISEYYNGSVNCKRELDTADHNQRPIVPVCLADAEPSRGVRFLLGRRKQIREGDFRDEEAFFRELCRSDGMAACKQ